MLYNLHNNSFIKGFFSWFGIEDVIFSSEYKKIRRRNPSSAIKSDLMKIKKDYQVSFNNIKKDIGIE